MLEKLGFKKKIHVGISLSANNFIELIYIDKFTKTVMKYASGNIKYNSAIREIMDFDEFTEVVEGLFEDAGLNPADCCVTLNLPNVQFGITSFDTASEEPFIIENLQSEIEDLYIFKRNEPIISFSKLDNGLGRGQKNIVYAAVQAKIVVKLVQIFDNMDVDIVRIDNSYSSMLKAIQFCDKFNKYVQKEEKTSILLVTPNSCCSFYLNGSIIVDYTEEPLAIKSFSTEEVYSTISKIITSAISKNNPQSLLIISETDEVNSEVLAQKLDFQGEIECINKNSDSAEPFIEVSGIGSDIDANMISYMTLEAVGAAAADYDEYPLNINFLPPDRVDENIIPVGAYEINLYRFIIIVLAGAIISALIIGFLFIFFLGLNLEKLKEDNNASEKQITIFQKNISEKEASQKKDILPVLTKILETNKSVIDVYTALSTDIPESIYIKKFVTNVNGGIGILGEAKTSESVQDFVKGLREKNGDLMLSKLSVNSKEDPVPAKIPNGFTFEIKTANTEVMLTDDILNTVQNGLSNVGQAVKNNTGRMAPPPAPMI